MDADIDDVISAVNMAPEEKLWDDRSPLWLRPQYRKAEAFRKDAYKQVVGHTPVEKISEKEVGSCPEDAVPSVPEAS